MLTNVVTACFERVLQRDGIGPEENFFDLGGDSLLVLSLLTEIETTTGRRLPITTIYDASTIKDIVSVLESANAPRFNSLVRIRSGTVAPPVFIIHPVFGNVIELIELGRQMPSQRAVYGIAARGLDGKEVPNESVETMADCYVEAIRNVQPCGPYILVGHSFGGLVALEAARRLRALGQEIAFLGLIDTYPQAGTWPLPNRMRFWAQQMLRVPQMLARMGGADAIRTVGSRLTGREFVGRREAVAATTTGNITIPRELRHVREAGYLALKRYQPSKYDGRVFFFRAAIPWFYPKDPSVVWRRFVTDLQIFTVPGDHYSIIRSHVAGLAKALSHHMEAAAAAGGDPAGRGGCAAASADASTEGKDARRLVLLQAAGQASTG